MTSRRTSRIVAVRMWLESPVPGSLIRPPDLQYWHPDRARSDQEMTFTEEKESVVITWTSNAGSLAATCHSVRWEGQDYFRIEWDEADWLDYEGRWEITETYWTYRYR